MTERAEYQGEVGVAAPIEAVLGALELRHGDAPGFGITRSENEASTAFGFPVTWAHPESGEQHEIVVVTRVLLEAADDLTTVTFWAKPLQFNPDALSPELRDYWLEFAGNAMRDELSATAAAAVSYNNVDAVECRIEMSLRFKCPAEQARALLDQVLTLARSPEGNELVWATGNELVEDGGNATDGWTRRVTTVEELDEPGQGKLAYLMSPWKDTGGDHCRIAWETIQWVPLDRAVGKLAGVRETLRSAEEDHYYFLRNALEQGLSRGGATRYGMEQSRAADFEL